MKPTPPLPPTQTDPARERLEAEVLARITPSPEERAAVAALVADLEAEATEALRGLGVPGRAQVQGSIAKDTYLAGDRDVDCFLLLDPGFPEDRLEAVTEAVAKRVLTGARKKYAQHPYLVGRRDGAQVDLVPAYAVAAAGERMSAVDRTPFHTAWVREHVDEALRGQVRLAKKWLKGVGVYGADTATAGFSGYLVEVLVVRFGSFAGLIDWLDRSASPRRIALGDDHVQDEVSLRVVVDPVDPARNCAAALGDETLEFATHAARAYRGSPHAGFFEPAPPRAETPEVLRDGLVAQDATWVGLELTPRTDRLDIVLPQFQKAARTLGDALDRAGFRVRRTQVRVGDDETGRERVGLQWVLDDTTLPQTTTHRGPGARVEPNARKFRAKWDGHPDAAGPVGVDADGRLAVEVRVRHRRPAQRLAADASTLGLGKHVQNALETHRVLDDPADADGFWAPAVADFVLDRPPWQRP